MKTDPDYDWLLSHRPTGQSLRSRAELARKVALLLQSRIKERTLPYTLGIFGGWGSGKTTFLAQVAGELEPVEGCRVIYFNAWKYAGFMEIVDRRRIRLRVWERGAGETLACGTGACAAVVAGIRRGLLDSPVEVQTRGGRLTIAWEGQGTTAPHPVRLTGPATRVFEGEIEI